METAANVPAVMKKTLAIDSIVNKRNTQESVTPVRTEYATNKRVAVMTDIVLILEDMSHINPNCARKIIHIVALPVKIFSINAGLPATYIAVSPEIRRASVIQR